MVFHFFNVVVGLVSRCIVLIFRLGCLKERKAVGNFQFIAPRVINLVLSKLFNQNPSKSLPNKLWTRQNYIHFLFPIWILQFSAGRHIWPDQIGPPGGTAAELANWEFQNVTGLANECNKASFVSPFFCELQRIIILVLWRLIPFLPGLDEKFFWEFQKISACCRLSKDRNETGGDDQTKGKIVKTTHSESSNLSFIVSLQHS